MPRLKHSQSYGPIVALVVPLDGSQVVLDQFGEGKDDVGAQERVDVCRQEFRVAVAVLGPVAVVTNSSRASF